MRTHVKIGLTYIKTPNEIYSAHCNYNHWCVNDAEKVKQRKIYNYKQKIRGMVNSHCGAIFAALARTSFDVLNYAEEN